MASCKDIIVNIDSPSITTKLSCSMVPTTLFIRHVYTPASWYNARDIVRDLSSELILYRELLDVSTVSVESCCLKNQVRVKL